MNLFDPIATSLQGSSAGIPAVSAQSGKPTENQLFADFQVTFSTVDQGTGEQPGETAPPAPDAPDGNTLPLATGKKLPDIAALPALPTLPLVETQDQVEPDAPEPANATARPAQHFAHLRGGTLIAAQGIVAGAPGAASAAGPAPAATLPASLGGAEPPVPTLRLPPDALHAAEGQKGQTPVLRAASPVLALPAHRDLLLAIGRAVPADSTDTSAPAQATAPIAEETLVRQFRADLWLRTGTRAMLAQGDGPHDEATGETPSNRAAAGLSSTAASAATPQPATIQTAPAVIATEAARVPNLGAASEPAQTSVNPRHDFTQVLDRLAEARELARPGRAQIQVAHREFGPVSMQFDVSGSTLKVALANAHAGFASAVHTALAERPVAAPLEALRTDTATLQAVSQSSQPSGTSSGQQGSSQQSGASQSGFNQPQGDGQHRSESNPRAHRVEPQPSQQAEQRETRAGHRPAGLHDKSLFA